MSNASCIDNRHKSMEHPLTRSANHLRTDIRLGTLITVEILGELRARIELKKMGTEQHAHT
jgi:hypothetical protein